MAEVATIARPYAEAVFALADKAGALAQWSDTLGRLAAIARAPEMGQLLGNPFELVEIVAGGKAAGKIGDDNAERASFAPRLDRDRITHF